MTIRKVRDVKTPEIGTSGSAGIDFFVPNDFSDVRVQPGESVNIPSGIRAHIRPGTALVAMNKSGIATKLGLIVGACVIDSDYQGELHLHVINVSNNVVRITPGMKLVQMLPLKIEKTEVVEMPDYVYNSWFDGETATERGEGGFGSTGI